jgi:AcrR family transcriptional regulator
VRSATIEEIKATAMRMLREHGADLRFADIARDMGMTAPALYRYFSDRDELLSTLMVDGFQDMSEALTEALDTAATSGQRGRARRPRPPNAATACGSPPTSTRRCSSSSPPSTASHASRTSIT